MADIKFIPDFGNVYWISPSGEITRNWKGRERKMSPYLGSNGYIAVSLSKNGKQKPYLLHRLIASTFIDNPLDLPCVNHKDGDKKNNSLDNLEWCTHSENISHAFKKGLRPNSMGGAHHKSVRIVCVDTGESFECIADASRKYGGDPKSIWRVCKGIRKSYRGYTWKYI